MPRSMTGFGQADEGGWLVEIKGVNRRYRDINIRLPKGFGPFEALIREMFTDVISRGKVDIFITKRSDCSIEATADINWEMAQYYYEALTAMASRFGGDVCFRDIIGVPGVLGSSSPDLDRQWGVLKGVIERAIDVFIRSKQGEGDRLKKDIFQRLDTLFDMVTKMNALSEEMPDLLRKRLLSNIDILLKDNAVPVDDVRIAQEVALMSERCDITEELVRLKSHLDMFRDVSNGSANPAGRRLDFILQEINREINTIGSKSQMSDLSHFVIDAKTEVEKIREQTANIE